MRKGTIFIQPHSDDAAMSSYFLIRAEFLPRPYYLLTIFSQSNWMDPIRKRDSRYTRNINQASVTRIRKAEDKKFAKLLNLTPIFLDLKDCLLRNKKVFYRPNKKLNENLVKRVRIIIAALIKKYETHNMVVPFPSGMRQHYDHRVTYEVVKSLPTNLCNRFFVDDVPYSRIMNNNKHNLSLFAKSRIDDINDKFRVMKIYDSQMCKLFFDQARKITKKNQGYERLFIFTNKQKYATTNHNDHYSSTEWREVY